MVQELTLTQLKAASETFYRALADVLVGDSGLMLELWSGADDVCYLGPMGEIVVGPEAVSVGWERQAARRLGGVVTPRDLHFVVGGTFGVVTNWEHGVSHSGIASEIKIRATSTYRLEDDTVRMIGHHTDLIE